MAVGYTASAQVVNDSTGVVTATKKEKKVKQIKFPHFYWGFSGGAGEFGLISDDESIVIENDLSFTGGIYFELQTMKWMSVEVGGYYTQISSTSTMDSYTTSFDAVDDMGVNYSHQVSAAHIVEESEAGLLEIPIAIKFLWHPGNWNFYLKPGASYTMLMNSSYAQKATVGISGYYPDNNVTYTNLPNHGYFTPKSFRSKGELTYTNSINPFIGAGIIMAGRGKAGVFFIEGKYYPGSIDFNGGQGNGTLFEGPMDNSEPNNYNFESITDETTVNIGGFLVQIGFRF